MTDPGDRRRRPWRRARHGAGGSDDNTAIENTAIENTAIENTAIDNTEMTHLP
ncbi:hypothetical protein [Mycolicibacterium palauense]|uniref:hypothetical protein n=1 Tax=Mycolicibacterium palauense TaxID=2034511 RepID=UPI00159B8FAA|nr:hypothetical protein [Mycolicibacterium palauense]